MPGILPEVAMLLVVADFLSSWCSYVMSLCVGHPLDTLRIRWQTRGQTPLVTLKSDGARSLFAGFLTPVFGNSPLVAFIFMMNERVKHFILDQKRSRRVDGDNNGRVELTPAELAVAGMVAGMCASPIQCPMTTVRIQQQLAKKQQQGCSSSTCGGGLSARCAAKNLVAAEGYRGLYRGFGLELMTNGIGRMFFFTTYETVKCHVAHKIYMANWGQQQKEGGATQQRYLTPAEAGEAASMPVRIAAAVCSSILGWIVIFPADVIKNRIQGDYLLFKHQQPQTHSTSAPTEKMYKSAADCARQTYKKLGWRGFWTGFSLTVVRTSIGSSISLPAFDYLKPKLRSVALSSSSSAPSSAAAVQ